MSGIHRDDRPALVVATLLIASLLVSGIVAAWPRINFDSDFHVFGDSWAQWVMAVFSAAATGVSLYAVQLVRKTWHETKRTADAAVRSADAAIATQQATLRAAAVDEANLIAQHRPWLTIEPDDVGPLRFAGPGVLSTTVGVVVKNIGTGPAVDVHIDCNTYWSYGNLIGRDVLETNIEGAKALAEIGPKYILIPQEDIRHGFHQTASDRRPAGTAPVQDSPIAVSATIVVLYRSMHSDRWFHTGHVLHIFRALPEGVPARSRPDFRWDAGDIASDDLACMVVPGNSGIA